MDFGVATVAAITAVIYIIGLGIKASPLSDKWIPVICGVAGMLLGLLAMYLHIPDYPAADPLTAAAVGGVSGLAAVGINQIGKQFSKEN